MAALPLPEIVLDLSRLLSRILHATPTGVDRVEMAWAQGLRARVPERLSFAALNPVGVYGRLESGAVGRFLDRTERDWAERAPPPPKHLRRAAPATVAGLWPRAIPRPTGPRVYLQASPHHLDRPGATAAILRREGARFACLVHDLIPIAMPEYARPGGAEQHRRRVTTMAAHADGLLFNSAATLAAIQPFLDRPVPSRVALLGADDFVARAAPVPADPYFLCIGTIEPRKNHLLLLNLWRRMAESGGPPPPRLIVIGRRGWENEMVVDMLDRCPSLSGLVEERGTVPDREVRALLAGARALLLPSFAEGYGMPVAEALAAGVPVICSDLAALREAGGDVPDYLDPLDGPAWARAIADHGDLASPRRAAQLARLAAWRAPTWARHLDMVLDLVQEVAAAEPRTNIAR